MPGFISWAAVSAGCSIAFFLPQGYSLYRAPPVITDALIAALALFLFAGVFSRKNRVRFTAFLFAAIAACTIHQAHQYRVFSSFGACIQSHGNISLIGKVVSPPLPKYEHFHFLFRIDSVKATSAAAASLEGITIDCTTPFEPPHYGTVAINGRYERPRARRNPYEYDEYTAMMAKGIWGRVAAEECRIVSAKRFRLEQLSCSFRAIAIRTLRKVADYDHRALLQACFLGDTEFLSPYIKDIFRASGIYHLIAISGLNTAMLTAALYFLLRLFPLGRIAPHLICITALWLYLLFVGMIPSLFRATIMATLVIAAFLFERKHYAMQTLGLAGTAWLFMSPESLFHPGYQLSFAATAAILVLFPVLYRSLPHPENRIMRPVTVFIYSSLCISLVSFCATAPVLLYHFGTISWYGIFANLIAVGAMTVSMWAFFFGLLVEMVAPFATTVPLWIGERFLDIVTGTGALAQRIPWSQGSYPVPWIELLVLYALFCIGCAAVRRERITTYLLISLAIIALFVPIDFVVRQLRPSATAVLFDLEKDAAAGIKWPDHRVWVVSTAHHASLRRQIERHILPWVRHCGRNRIDMLLVPENAAKRLSLSTSKSQALSGARMVTFADKKKETPATDHPSAHAEGTLLLRAAPCRGCAYWIRERPQGIDLHIAACGTDTCLYLPFPGTQKKTTAGPHRERSGAVIYAFKRKRIQTSRSLREDHPLVSSFPKE